MPIGMPNDNFFSYLVIMMDFKNMDEIFYFCKLIGVS